MLQHSKLKITAAAIVRVMVAASIPLVYATMDGQGNIVTTQLRPLRTVQTLVFSNVLATEVVNLEYVFAIRVGPDRIAPQTQLTIETSALTA
jgi:hypothetical protein